MGATVCNGQNQSPDFSNRSSIGQMDSKQKMMNTTAPPDGKSSQAHEEMANEQNVDEAGEQKVKHQEQEEFQKITMFSIKKTNRINFQTLQVIDVKEKRKRINQFQIDAPYSIIGLSISKELRMTINRIGRDIFAKYFQENIKQGWKLHKNGYYINYLGKKLTAIFTQHSYFQGELYDEGTKILAKGKGIMLNQNGRYEGQFQLGMASGRGTFEDYKKNAFYNGVWKDGKMIEGVIQCPQYKFKGKLKNSIAHGQGQIHLLEKEIFYSGKFKKGIYYDKNAIYETKDYVYEGCFVEGKKNGDGTLVQKQRQYNKDKKVKYRPPTQYQGEFSKDIFLNKQLQQEINLNQQAAAGAGAGPTNSILQNLKPQVFEQEIQVKQQKTSGIDASMMHGMLQEDYDKLKPKFIWIEPPRPKKIKKPLVDLDQF